MGTAQCPGIYSPRMQTYPGQKRYAFICSTAALAIIISAHQPRMQIFALFFSVIFLFKFEDVWADSPNSHDLIRSIHITGRQEPHRVCKRRFELDQNTFVKTRCNNCSTIVQQNRY